MTDREPLDLDALEARIRGLDLSNRDSIVQLDADVAALIAEVRRLRNPYEPSGMVRSHPGFGTWLNVPSLGQQVIEQDSTFFSLEPPFSLDEPLSVKKGDILLISLDGRQVGRYDSDGNLIETREVTR